MPRIKEIERRLLEIRSAMNEEGADINALNEEADVLLEERRVLMEAETRRSTLDKIARGAGGEGSPVIPEEEKRGYDASSAEYRAAFLNSIREIPLSETEKRAFTSVAGSAGAVIPTQTANEIIKKMKQYAPLLNEVTLLQVTGNVTFAVESTVNDAEKHAENANIAPKTDKLTPVTLTAYEITKLVQVSKTVSTMSIDAFETWLVDMLAEKVTEGINRYLISGTGASEPTGVEKANTWGEGNSVTIGKAASLTATDVQTLIGMLNGSYDRNAKFLMSKKTLFTDFMPLEDKSKNSIVRVEGHDYFIYGYPVLLDDNIALHEAYLGDFKKIVANLSEAVTVTSGFDINTNSYKFLGCAMFDSKVADGDAFVKLVKAAA